MVDATAAEPGRQEVQREEATAEAGPGAATTDAVPLNETNQDVSRGEALPNGADGAEQEKHVQLGENGAQHSEKHEPGATALEKAPTGKKVIIMLSLCVSTYTRGNPSARKNTC